MDLHASTFRCNGGYRNQKKPDACLQRQLHACLRVFSCTPAPILFFLFFSLLFYAPLLLEQHLGDLGLYIRTRDLLVVTRDLARELQLALTRLVDQLVDGAPGQEAADLDLALLAETVGTVLAVFRSVKLKCAISWGGK